MRIVFDACNNILAAEYLFRTDNKREYNRRIKQLCEIQLNDELMYELHFRLALNWDYTNLGFMYTSGKFDGLLKVLTDYLDKSEGMDCLANHGVMSVEEYLAKEKKGTIQSDEDAEGVPDYERRQCEDENN